LGSKEFLLLQVSKMKMISGLATMTMTAKYGLTLAMAWMASPTLFAQEPPERFVVEDVWFAEAPRGPIGFDWIFHLIWDLTGDGAPEVLRIGQYDYLTKPIGSRPTSIASLRATGPNNALWEKIYNRFDNGFTPPNTAFPLFLLSPFGLRSARISQDSQSIGIFDWMTLEMNWVNIPKGQVPGILNEWANNLADIGDLDRDGFFDIGYSGGGFDQNSRLMQTFSVISGRTMKPFWTVSQTDPDAFYFLDFFGIQAGNAMGTDANSDGMLDPIVAWWDQSDPDVTYKCLSGSDGSVLWSAGFANSYSGSFTARPTGWRVGDLDSDGVLDLLVWRKGFRSGAIVDPGFLEGVSGRDGSVLWHTDRYDWDPNYGSGTSTLGLYRFYPWADHGQDGYQDLVSLAQGVPVVGGGTTEELWIFSGKDGSHIGSIDFKVPNLEPWAPDTLYLDSVIMTEDLNRDGWPERFIGAPNGTQPGTHLVIFSVETLRMPEEVKVGQTLTYKVHIPNGANKNFRLMVSSTFLHHQPGRYMIGNWDTQLGVDPTTSLFLPDPATRGTLDSKGWYVGQLQIPANQGLENTTINVRGIIEDPSHPSGVRTMTTLSTIQVTP
jgi:hypothetical protein